MAREITRKQFMQGLTGLCLVFTVSCGSEDDGDDDSSSGSGGDGDGDGGDDGGGGCSTDIGSNHGHTMTVSAADLAGGTDIEYDIAGGAGHSHTVTVTAADFEDLMNGMTVNKKSSSDDSHDHTIQISC